MGMPKSEQLGTDVMLPMIMDWLKDPAVAFPDGMFACLKEIYGTESAETFILDLWKFITIVVTTPEDTEDEPLPGQYSIEHMIPAGKVNKVVGENGKSLESLQEQAGCKIRVIQDGKFTGKAEKPARITGEQENCEKARNLIIELVEQEEDKEEEEASEDIKEEPSHEETAADQAVKNEQVPDNEEEIGIEGECKKEEPAENSESNENGEAVDGEDKPSEVKTEENDINEEMAENAGDATENDVEKQEEVVQETEEEKKKRILSQLSEKEKPLYR